ncbi:hypothetical protein TrCOL_g4091 [Triparma columacea]|uniref:Sulfotransferase domain-containing protein n=1 Tax=Triparma columacea TaxID=722753 RepID=A0A9W7L353_9STRA|nr:hypothetical protein TrCOL_g4091 [Triparma columacea]
MSQMIQMNPVDDPEAVTDLESVSLPPLPDDASIFSPHKYSRTFALTPTSLTSPNTSPKWFPFPSPVGGSDGGYKRLVSNLVPGNKDIWVISYPHSKASPWVKGLVEELLNITGGGYDASIEEKAGGEGGLDWIGQLNKIGKDKVRVFHSHLPVEFLHPLTNSNSKIIYLSSNPKDVASNSYLSECSSGSFEGPFSAYLESVFLPSSNVANYGSYWNHVQSYLASADYGNIVNDDDEIREVFQVWAERLALELEEGVEGIREFVGGRGTAENWRSSNSFDLSVGSWKDHFTVSQSEFFDKVHERRVQRIANNGGGAGWGGVIWEEDKATGGKATDAILEKLGISDQDQNCVVM